MAAEIIFQIGDREFWKQYDDMKSYIKLSYEIILEEPKKETSAACSRKCGGSS